MAPTRVQLHARPLTFSWKQRQSGMQNCDADVAVESARSWRYTSPICDKQQDDVLAVHASSDGKLLGLLFYPATIRLTRLQASWA